MPLAPGTKLGPYEISAALGAGGMGEVYKARDTRLERTVAIKVLASHLTATPEMKQRFEREARAISSLNHPHICHLYDIGAQDGTDYLVMEFLEGETLAERLRRGLAPAPELLRTGAEVAEALEVAHRAGIVHRDLKPGNIMLTKSGAKLMDFGLAKPAAVGAAASGSAPLLSAARTTSNASPMSPLTTAGSIVGTIQYMAPEQIEGKNADARSDVFALGSVLYEMATGKRAFEGKSQLSVASAILEKDPEPISTVQPQIAPALEHVVTRALAKNPEDRWQSASDVCGELRWIAANPSSGRISLPAMGATKKNRERWAWVVACIAIVAAIIAAGLYFTREQTPSFAIRSEIPAPKNANFVFVGDNGGPPVLSPDGKTLAFVASDALGTQQIYVRSLDSVEEHALAGTENAWAPFWSPDGRKIAFFADTKLKIVDAQGGSPAPIADVPNARGGSWSVDGDIIYAPDYRSALFRVPASGGMPVQVTKLDQAKQTSHRWPYCLPDGKHFLYLAVNHESPLGEDNAIYFASFDGKETVRLASSITEPQYANGMLLYVRDGELVGQSLDAASGKLKDDAQQVVNGVTQDNTTWRAMFTVSQNGLLAYSGGSASRDTQLAWFDRSGKQLGTIGDKIPMLNGPPVLSPAADRVALVIDTGNANIWVLDIARNVRTRLTFGPGDLAPVWSPDGKSIAYGSVTRNGFVIARRSADGGAEEALVPESQVVMTPTNWSRDGKYMLYTKGAIGTHTECWALPMFGDRKPFPVVPPGKFQCNSPALSPDDKWLAYNTDESGRFEIYVVPFGGKTGGRWQVSTAGGSAEEWRSDGKEIFYGALNNVLMAVPVTEQGEQLKLGAPQPLFQTQFASIGGYDVAPGGQKVMTNVITDRSSQPLTLVVNWTADLKKQ